MTTRTIRVWAGLGFLSIAAGAACSKTSSGDAPPAPATTAPATPPAASTATVTPPAASASAKPEPGAYAPHKVPAGFSSDGIWTTGFEILRDKGNANLTYLEATNKCTAAGKALCTDVQWARACSVDAELAKMETWTASAVGGGRFVTRGGTEAGCRARDVADGTEHKSDRVAVCCDRAVGIKTDNKNEAFLKSAAKRLQDYEAALRARDTLALGSQYDDKVTFLGKDYPNVELIKLHEKDFKLFPDQWMLFDTCNVRIDKVTTDKGPDVKLASDCRTVFHRKGNVLVAMQRLLWGGAPTMKVQLIGDPVTARMQAPDGTMIEEKETKERVGVLLAAD